ncbi:MAG: 5'-methylthioadenosine/S-adenosylhomocysteine nucleosidase [Oceanospirillaceae bacterium]
MASILFICALTEEKKALTDILGKAQYTQVINAQLAIEVSHYQQGSLDIYICQSGMGNVNAAVQLALILSTIKIQQIVLLGVGGALHSQLNIGDMIVSNKVIQHDYYSSLAQGNFLMRPGDLILDPLQAQGYDPVMHSIDSHFNLLPLTHPQVKVLEGLVASGSEFVGTAQRKQAIHQQCQHALLVDMEASAIAAVALRYSTAFLIAKTVSDKLHSDGSISNDFTNFLANASRNAAIVAQSIIEKNIEISLKSN